jgi:chromosome segregation ATPase
MTENVENPVPEHLRAIRGDIGRLSQKLDEHTQRLGRIEVAVSSLRRDIANNEESWAEQSIRIDRLAERIERIERRLEFNS